jgi:general secretion pathway protein G
MPWRLIIMSSLQISAPNGSFSMRRYPETGRHRGFTLIELLVVLVIIGLLAALVVPNVLNRADDARVTTARSDIQSLMNALKLYKLDNFRYPTQEQGLDALLRKPTTGPIPANWRVYVEKAPKDPWGNPYQYAVPGRAGEVEVFSFGADGVAGGEGVNADIGSWQP